MNEGYADDKPKPAGKNLTLGGEIGEVFASLDDVVDRNRTLIMQLREKMSPVLSDPSTTSDGVSPRAPGGSVVRTRLCHVGDAVHESNMLLSDLLERTEF